MRLDWQLENVRLMLKSIQRERNRARKEKDRILREKGSSLLEGWERGRECGLFSAKVRMGYVYKSLRKASLEGAA